MPKMNTLDWVAWIILLVGGLNWGMVGLFDFNLVSALFGAVAIIERLVYIVVGLSALYFIYKAATMKKTAAPVQ
jgi:uncharacterized protein